MEQELLHQLNFYIYVRQDGEASKIKLKEWINKKKTKTSWGYK